MIKIFFVCLFVCLGFVLNNCETVLFPYTRTFIQEISKKDNCSYSVVVYLLISICSCGSCKNQNKLGKFVV